VAEPASGFADQPLMLKVPVSTTSLAMSESLRLESWLAARRTSNACVR
jgi:hypothetical protein